VSYALVQLFRELSKIVLTRSKFFSAQNAPNVFWRLGCARTCRGSLNALANIGIARIFSAVHFLLEEVDLYLFAPLKTRYKTTKLTAPTLQIFSMHQNCCKI